MIDFRILGDWDNIVYVKLSVSNLILIRPEKHESYTSQTFVSFILLHFAKNALAAELSIPS